MLEVEPTGQRGPMTTASGRSGHDLEQLTSSLSPLRLIKLLRQIKLWLLLNINKKTQAAYHLPVSSISSNNRKGPNLTFCLFGANVNS